MTDLALAWNALSGTADLTLAGAALATDDGLRTAVLVSLFTDARARDGDPLPAPEDRRGWWGDGFALEDGDAIGSRLWLLGREKMLPSVVVRARDYVREALAWLVDDGIAAAVDVTVERQGFDRLAIGVTITRPTGPAREHFDFVWGATGAV